MQGALSLCAVVAFVFKKELERVPDILLWHCGQGKIELEVHWQKKGSE